MAFFIVAIFTNAVNKPGGAAHKTLSLIKRRGKIAIVAKLRYEFNRKLRRSWQHNKNKNTEVLKLYGCRNLFFIKKFYVVMGGESL